MVMVMVSFRSLSLSLSFFFVVPLCDLLMVQCNDDENRKMHASEISNQQTGIQFWARDFFWSRVTSHEESNVTGQQTNENKLLYGTVRVQY
jgi:hypothetical protein